MCHPVDKRVNLQVTRADTIHGRDDTTQYMIKAVIRLRILHSHDILHILHHANDGFIAVGVGADRTHIGVTDVVTHPTILDILAHMLNGRSKRLGR